MPIHTLRTATVCAGLGVVLASCASVGLLPAIIAVLIAVILVFASAHLALSRPDAWLALYVAVLLVIPDPHFEVAGVPMGVNASDPMFLGALPSLILRPIGRYSTLARIAFVLWLWAGVTLISAFVFSGPLVAAGSALRWIRLAEALFPILFVFQRIADPAQTLKRCVPVFIAAATLASIFGIADFFIGIDLSFLGISYDTVQLVYSEEIITRRAVGLFYEAGGFGIMSALLAWVSLFLLMTSRHLSMGERLFLLVAIGVGSLALLLSFTRSALLGLMGAMFLSIFLGGSSIATKTRVIVRTAILLLLALGMFLLFTPDWVDWFLESRLLPAAVLLGDYTSQDLVGVTSGRTDIWAILLSAFWNNGLVYQIVGIGYKSLPFSGLAANSDWTGLVTGESQFVTTLIEQGIVGLALFLVLNFLVLIGLWRASRDRLTQTGQWARLLLVYWMAQVLFVFPVLDYFAIFRMLPIVFCFVALVLAKEAPGRVPKRAYTSPAAILTS